MPPQCQHLVKQCSNSFLAKGATISRRIPRQFEVWRAHHPNRRLIHQSNRLSSFGTSWPPFVPSIDDVKHLNLEDLHPKHREMLEADRSRLHYNDRVSLRSLIAWLESGPPPITEYRLTFGKHKGKLLEEVPDSYMVKYLIPRHKEGVNVGHCPIVGIAVEDYMKRHPEVKSQAGNAKTEPLEGDVLKSPVAEKKRRRPSGKAAKLTPIERYITDGVIGQLRRIRQEGSP